ncbi:hypothetical protein ACX40Y_00840 [Sphingomonas sp. RS6]
MSRFGSGMKDGIDPDTGHSTLGGDYEQPGGHLQLRGRPWRRTLVIALVIVAALAVILLTSLPR